MPTFQEVFAKKSLYFPILEIVASQLTAPLPTQTGNQRNMVGESVATDSPLTPGDLWMFKGTQVRDFSTSWHWGFDHALNLIDWNECRRNVTYAVREMNDNTELYYLIYVKIY